MNAVFYLISCRLRSRWFYNLISFMVVALCVMVLILALSLSNGFEKTLIDKIIIASPHVSIFGDYLKIKMPDKSSIDTALKLAQVQALAINNNNDYVQGILLRGTDPKDIPELFGNKNVLIEGHFPAVGEAIIGTKFAQDSELKTGDTIRVLTGPAIIVDLEVSGIYKVGLYDFDSSVVIATYNDIVNLTPEPGEGVASQVKTFYSLWLNKPFNAASYARDLMAMNQDIFVSNWQDDNKSLVSAIALEKKVIFIVLLLLVIAASVAIANSQFIQIVSQQQQIAILSAIGFPARNIMLTFILEGLVIALIGSIMGIILAYCGVYYLSTYPLTLPMEIYQVDKVPVLLKWIDVAIIVFATILMVIIASLVPAFYASRLDPVEILRRA